MKVLVVDDEPLARTRLVRLLGEHADCEWVLEAANGAEAVACNEQRDPDVILMDIRMPGMDGIEAARHIMRSPRPPAIIFCTAYEEYAIAAFESRAVGYLLKPVARDKLLATLAAARATTRVQLQALADLTQAQRSFLSAHSASGVRLVPVAEVRLLLAEQKYVTAFYPEGTLLLDESLRELENEFPQRFLRVHRNALVATRHISGLSRRARGDFVVTLAGLDRQVQVSRRHLGAVREALARL